jgi:voltage-gated potassium channel
MGLLQRWADRDKETSAVGRHTILLSSLIFLLIVMPLFRVGPGSGIRFSILLCLVLSAAVYFNSTDRRVLIGAFLAGGGAIIGTVLSVSIGSTAAQITAQFLGLGLLSFTTLFMLNTLMQTRDVSQDTIIGGICVYLLIGLCFTLAFTLAIDLGGGVLIDGGEPLVRSGANESARAATAIYFSFVTLTTLGYGDITPKGEIIRMLATTEAIIGQLYVAIFIARLIAMRRN